MSPIRVDPIENSDIYQAAMAQIQPELDKLPTDISVHVFWAEKKRLLKELDIDWRTPAEMNPEIIFD